MGIWRSLITQLRLCDLADFPARGCVLNSLEEGIIDSPIDLAALSHKEALGLDQLLGSKVNAIILLHDSLCWKEAYPKDSENFRQYRNSDIHREISSLRADNISEKEYRQQLISLGREFWIAHVSDNFLPIARILALSLSLSPTGAVRDKAVVYVRLGAKGNAIRSVLGPRETHSSVAPCIHSYASFCSLAGRPFSLLR